MQDAPPPTPLQRKVPSSARTL